MRSLLSTCLAATLLLPGLLGCQSQPEDAVVANVYYRYDPVVGSYTVEVELSRTEEGDSIVTAYLPEGGVSFLGSNVENDINEPSYNRFRTDFKSDFVEGAKVTFQGLAAKPITIAATLPAQDSFIIGGHITHNFGITVYSVDTTDRLLPNESLAALYQADDGQSYLGELQGPTKEPRLFQFVRQVVGSWPMGQGSIVFIRRRITPIEQDGVKGMLTEEVYSRPQPTGVFN